MFAKYSGGVGGSYGFGVSSDNVIDATGSNNLTTAWGANAAYEHFWNPHWQTSVYGGYSATTYDTAANATLCTMEGGPIASANCSNNWSIWNIGTRTQFNLDSQTSMGVDIVYQNLNTANAGAAILVTNGTQLGGLRTIANQSALMGQFRIHRNFYP
jgi:hypothetical protein